MAVIKDVKCGQQLFIKRWEHNLEAAQSDERSRQRDDDRAHRGNEDCGVDPTSHLTRVDERRYARANYSSGACRTPVLTVNLLRLARLPQHWQQLLSMFSDTDSKRDAILRSHGG